MAGVMVCIQCAMKAVVERLSGHNEMLTPADFEKIGPPPNFEQTPEEHMRMYHPDPEATQREREELEAKLALLLAKAPRRKM